MHCPPCGHNVAQGERMGAWLTTADARIGGNGDKQIKRRRPIGVILMFPPKAQHREKR